MARTGPKYTRPRDKALKALIRRAGSINAIADYLDISRQSVSQWLTISPKHKDRLMQAFPE